MGSRGFSEEIKVLFAAAESGRTDVLKSAIDLIESKRTQLADEISDTYSPIAGLSMMQNGMTPLHLAAVGGHVDATRLLLRAGSDPALISHEGYFNGKSPYDIATATVKPVFAQELFQQVALGNPTRVASLLDCGVHPDVLDGSPMANIPLHWAASFGQVPIISLLLDRKSNPNAVNSHGMTPLHQACIGVQEESAKILLAGGADPTIKCTDGDYVGKSAIDIAAEQGMDLNIDIPVSEENLNLITEIEVNTEMNEIEQQDNFKILTSSVLPLIWPPPELCTVNFDKICRLQDGSIGVVMQGTVGTTTSQHFSYIESALKSSGIFTFSSGYSSPPMKDYKIITLCVSKRLVSRRGPQAYRLKITPEGVLIEGSDTIGLLYGTQTFCQVISFYEQKNEPDLLSLMSEKCVDLPCLCIEDRPSVLRRAAMLDLRLPYTPSVAEAIQSIQRLSSWRFNVVIIMFNTDTCSRTSEFNSPLENGDIPGHKASWNWNSLSLIRDVCSAHCIETVAGWWVTTQDLQESGPHPKDLIHAIISFSQQMRSTEVLVDLTDVSILLDDHDSNGESSLHVQNLVNFITNLRSKIDASGGDTLVLAGLQNWEAKEIEKSLMPSYSRVLVLFACPVHDSNDVRSHQNPDNGISNGYFSVRNTKIYEYPPIGPADLSLTSTISSAVRAANLASQGVSNSVLTPIFWPGPTYLNPLILDLSRGWALSGILWSPAKASHAFQMQHYASSSVPPVDSLGHVLCSHLQLLGVYMNGAKVDYDSVRQFLFPAISQSYSIGTALRDAWVLLRLGNELEGASVELSPRSLAGFRMLRQHLGELDLLHQGQSFLGDLWRTASLLRLACRTLLIVGHHFNSRNQGDEVPSVTRVTLENAVKYTPQGIRLDLANRFLREYERVRQHLDPPLYNKAHDVIVSDSATFRFCYKSLLAVVELLTSDLGNSSKVNCNALICKSVIYGEP